MRSFLVFATAIVLANVGSGLALGEVTGANPWLTAGVLPAAAAVVVAVVYGGPAVAGWVRRGRRYVGASTRHDFIIYRVGFTGRKVAVIHEDITDADVIDRAKPGSDEMIGFWDDNPQFDGLTPTNPFACQVGGIPFIPHTNPKLRAAVEAELSRLVADGMVSNLVAPYTVSPEFEKFATPAPTPSAVVA